MALFLLGAASSSALVVGTPAPKLAVTHPAPARFAQPFMGSQEDKEFEEWVRQKKIKSGVDPDEDFGSGRRAEGLIYTVGGARPCPHHARKIPLHQLGDLPLESSRLTLCTCACCSQVPSPSLCRLSLELGRTTRDISRRSRSTCTNMYPFCGRCAARKSRLIM